MNCKDCSYKKFYDGNGRPGRYYCFHDEAKFARSECEPHAYLNFSYLIESYMGKTAQNLQRVFDYCKGQKCVLMLDEIDCIGLESAAYGSGTGTGHAV